MLSMCRKIDTDCYYCYYQIDDDDDIDNDNDDHVDD